MVHHKDNFNVVSEATDEHGEVIVFWSQTQASAALDAKTFIMDYTGLADWTGEIEVKALNRDAISRALDAFKLYGPCIACPNGYANMLK